MCATEIDYYHHRISYGELAEALTSTELRVLSISSYTVNELSVFLKLLRANHRENWELEPQQDLYIAQRFTLLRQVTLRLFEFRRLLLTHHRTKNRIGELSKALLETWEESQNTVGLAVAEVVRDKLSAHTSVADLKSILKTIPSETDVSSFHARDPLNSVHRLGEEVVMAGHLKALIKAEGSLDNVVLSWMRWVDETSRSVFDFYHELSKELILSRGLDDTEQISCRFPDGLHARMDHFEIPLVVEARN